MRYLLSLLAAGTLSACAGTAVQTTPQWDANFGTNTRVALAQQVIHPDAGRNRDPVAGMDGRAARTVYDRYQKSYTEPAQQPSTFTIGVSGAK